MDTLNTFVERSRLREAFNCYATGAPLSVHTWEARSRVPAFQPSRAAHAFDYLVRFEVGRWSVTNHVDALATTWAAHWGLHNLTCDSTQAEQVPRWARFLEKAVRRIDAYLAGEPVPIEERVLIALHLAQLDPLFHDPHTHVSRLNTPCRPSGRLVRQLTLWLNQWQADWATFAPPHQRVLINPEFNWVPKVGGSDTDLVLDGLLVGVQSTHRSGTVLQIRQLCGQAAMATLAGFHLPGHAALSSPVDSIGVYQVRAAAGDRWHRVALKDLFPDGGWRAYLEAFTQEVIQEP